MLKLFFSITIVLCSYFFYHWVSQNETEPQEEFIETVPTYIANDLTSTTFSKYGFPYRELSATEVQYYDYLGTGYFLRPNMTYFPELDASRKESEVSKGEFNLQDLEMWTLSSDYGIANVNDNLNLRGNIVGHSTKHDAIVTDIYARYLEYDLNTQDIRTNEKITLAGKELNDTCEKVSGNLKDQYYLLEENCHATYNVPKKSHR